MLIRNIFRHLIAYGFTPLMIGRRLQRLLPYLRMENDAVLMAANKAMTVRITNCGDSTAALEHGTWWSSTAFFGRSDASGHVADAVGTLTIYQNGTAKWAADGDTAGALVSVVGGFYWFESASADKGFCFCIMPDDISGASPTGTAHAITVAAGSIAGSVGFISAGAVVWQNILSGWRTCITGILGAGGTTTFHLLDRIDNVFDVDSHGHPLSVPPDVIHVSCGINDCTALGAGGAGYTIAEVLQNLTDIKDAILARGGIPVFSSLSHETPGNRQTYMDQVNAHLLAMSVADSRVYFADYAAEVDDVGGDAKPNYMIGPHYTPYLGAKVCGEVFDVLLDSIAGLNQGRSIYFRGAANLAPAGDCQGTGGQLINATGVSALDVWCGTGLGVDIGDCTAVCSKEASTGETNPWQVVAVTGGTEDSYVMVTTEMTSISDLIQSEAEFYVSDASKMGGGIIDALRFSFIFYDEFDAPIDFLAGMYAVAGDAGVLQGVVKTDKITPPANAVSARVCFMWWQPATFDVTFKVRNWGASDVS